MELDQELLDQRLGACRTHADIIIKGNVVPKCMMVALHIPCRHKIGSHQEPAPAYLEHAVHKRIHRQQSHN